VFDPPRLSFAVGSVESFIDGIRTGLGSKEPALIVEGDARSSKPPHSALDEFLGVGWSPKIASPARQFVRNEDSRLTLPQGGQGIADRTAREDEAKS
jgi:hypothetical protein